MFVLVVFTFVECVVESVVFVIFDVVEILFVFGLLSVSINVVMSARIASTSVTMLSIVLVDIFCFFLLGEGWGIVAVVRG